MKLDNVVANLGASLLSGWSHPEIIHGKQDGLIAFRIAEGRKTIIERLAYVLFFSLFAAMFLFFINTELYDYSGNLVFSFFNFLGVLFFAHLFYSMACRFINEKRIEVDEDKLQVRWGPLPLSRSKTVDLRDLGYVTYYRPISLDYKGKGPYRILRPGERSSFVVSAHTRSGAEFLSVNGNWTEEEASAFAEKLREALQLKALEPETGTRS